MDQIPRARLLPIAQAPPARHPRSAPEFLGEHLPGNAAAKDEDNAGEAGAIRDTRPPTLWPSWNRQERLDNIPQRIWKQRRGHSRPRYLAQEDQVSEVLLQALSNLLNVEPDLASSAIRASFEQPSGDEAEKRSAHARPWQSYALVAALMVALGYGVYLTWRTWQTPASVSNGAALTLRAERRGKMLRVSWNRDNPVVNHARDAVLSIRDGDLQPKELHLDREQLRNGTVVYSAAKDSVQFRLEVRRQDETKTSETILAGVAPKARLTARLIAAGRPAAGSSTRNRRSSRPGGAVLVDPPPPPASFHPQALAQIEQVVFAQPKLAVLPSQESQQGDMNPAFIGPRPIHQSLPNLPSEIRATIISEVEVQVKLQVDEDGRVVKVDFVEATGPASNALVSATRQAARLWRFAPGARGSEPVASEVVLMFRYIPKPAGIDPPAEATHSTSNAAIAKLSGNCSSAPPTIGIAHLRVWVPVRFSFGACDSILYA